MSGKRLYRTEGGEKVLAGVCGGVAEYLDLDPSIVRVLWAVAACAGSLGIWAYVVCALVLPAKSDLDSM